LGSVILVATVRSPSLLHPRARRFFLNEVEVGPLRHPARLEMLKQLLRGDEEEAQGEEEEEE